MSLREKATLALILLLAGVLRLWDVTSYIPLFWDEAKYLSEVEKIIPFFGVNVGSYAFLKVAHATIGGSCYPQVVTALLGLLSVVGCFSLGRRMLTNQQSGVRLGLLMAGQAAIMPYLLRYSRHALSEGFAFCFFVIALDAYVAKLQHPRVKGIKLRRSYLRTSVAAGALLAMVCASSFKFLLPTLILFLTLEGAIWRVRMLRFHERESNKNLLIALLVGIVLFAALPLVLAAISGYGNWFGRAMELSRAHAEIGTMRLAMHFLFPVHLFYLAGVVFILCAAGGTVLLFGKSQWSNGVTGARSSGLVLAVSLLIYLLFFGLFSHLQAARVYVLTLPFMIFASSLCILDLRALTPRWGSWGGGVLLVLLMFSMGYLSFEYLSTRSGLRFVSDATAQRLHPGQPIWTNLEPQVQYGIFTSAAYRKTPFIVESFLHANERKLDPKNPPLIIIQDASDLVSFVATLDKFGRMSDNPEDTVRSILQDFRTVAQVATPLCAVEDNFYSTPYAYLEDIYSWKSYEYVSELMPSTRDSIFVYLQNPIPSSTHLH